MTSPPGAIQTWVLAARPKTLSAAAAPVLAGIGFAVADGAFRAMPALAALVGGLLIQIATNLANDYYDFVKGGDTDERLGPTRVTQSGLLPPSAVKRGMMVTLGLAFLVGIYLVSVGGWPIVVIGLLSLICAVAYTGGPFPLAYNGLGDVFVFVFFGPVAVGGTYWVQALDITPDVLLAGAGLGAFATGILVVNNLRDRQTDEKAGKRTLAVRFGDHAMVAEWIACVSFAASVILWGVFGRGWSTWALLGLLGVAVVFPTWSLVRSGPSLQGAQRKQLNPGLGGTAKGVALYGVGLGLGLILGSVLGTGSG